MPFLQIRAMKINLARIRQPDEPVALTNQELTIRPVTSVPRGTFGRDSLLNRFCAPPLVLAEK